MRSQIDREKDIEEAIDDINESAQGVDSPGEAKSEAERVDDMKGSFDKIAENLNNLLTNIISQLPQESKQRENIIKYLKRYLCFVTVLPIVILIIAVLAQNIVGPIVLGASVIMALLNIPVSAIGVLKTISERLFNDTYRDTLPAMVTEITKSLSMYNLDYQAEETSRKKGQNHSKEKEEGKQNKTV